MSNNKRKIRFHNYMLSDDDVNRIYNKIANIICRDAKFTFKYHLIIDDRKYKINGIIKRIYCYDHPNIYFINLKFIPDDIWINDGKIIQMILDGTSIKIHIGNFEFLTGKERPDISQINIFPNPKDFINTFKRIDKDYYLVNLILSIFNGEYSFGSMMIPYIKFYSKL